MGSSYLPRVSTYGQDRRHSQERTEHREHEYQEIGEIIKTISDDEDNIKNICDKRKNNSHCERKVRSGCDFEQLPKKFEFGNILVYKNNVTLGKTVGANVVRAHERFPCGGRRSGH